MWPLHSEELCILKSPRSQVEEKSEWATPVKSQACPLSCWTGLLKRQLQVEGATAKGFLCKPGAKTKRVRVGGFQQADGEEACSIFLFPIWLQQNGVLALSRQRELSWNPTFCICCGSLHVKCILFELLFSLLKNWDITTYLVDVNSFGMWSTHVIGTWYLRGICWPSPAIPRWEPHYKF